MRYLILALLTALLLLSCAREYTVPINMTVEGYGNYT